MITANYNKSILYWESQAKERVNWWSQTKKSLVGVVSLYWYILAVSGLKTLLTALLILRNSQPLIKRLLTYCRPVDLLPWLKNAYLGYLLGGIVRAAGLVYPEFAFLYRLPQHIQVRLDLLVRLHVTVRHQQLNLQHRA